jgi:hypothetical protein
VLIQRRTGGAGVPPWFLGAHAYSPPGPPQRSITHHNRHQKPSQSVHGWMATLMSPLIGLPLARKKPFKDYARCRSAVVNQSTSPVLTEVCLFSCSCAWQIYPFFPPSLPRCGYPNVIGEDAIDFVSFPLVLSLSQSKMVRRERPSSPPD